MYFLTMVINYWYENNDFMCAVIDKAIKVNAQVSLYPGLKGLLWGSSSQIVYPSVCLFVRFVHNSVLLTYKVQYFKFGGDTVTKFVL